jgi:hypothetical protein
VFVTVALGTTPLANAAARMTVVAEMVTGPL